MSDNTCNWKPSSELEEKPDYYVEIQLKRNSSVQRSQIEEHVKLLILSNGFKYLNPACQHYPELKDHVEEVVITPGNEAEGQNQDNDNIHLSKEVKLFDLSVQVPNPAYLKFRFCVYHLNYDEPGQELLDDKSELAAATHWLLPSAHLQGMWENLIYDSNIKSNLLNFASTALLFSDHNVNSNVISWNRVVLLHGPPGTGKTSLCKALAQKLSIRFASRYSYGQLIEINSHSLFSKWFSESGKLVLAMFEKIREFLDDSNALVFVLLDEIESLVHARKSAGSGNEPSDAIRVVNAILTQLDMIQKYPNVLVLTTSNITGAIDLAFVDRADIKQYIGLPSPKAIYKIYESCALELIRTGILTTDEQKFSHYSKVVTEIAEKSQGLSGRALRKLPFLAHALYLQKKVSTVPEFLNALSLAVNKQFEDMAHLETS